METTRTTAETAAFLNEFLSANHTNVGRAGCFADAARERFGQVEVRVRGRGWQMVRGKALEAWMALATK